MSKKKPYNPEDDWPSDDEDEFEPDYSRSRPCQNILKWKPCPHEEQLAQIATKAARIQKELRQIERALAKAAKKRAKWQKQVEKAYSRAKARRDGTAGEKKEGKPDAGQPHSQKETTNSAPAPGTTYIGGGTIRTIIWTREKRLIESQTNGQTTTKWIPNKWQP